MNSMSGNFDLILVGLSFLVSVVASYTALELSRKVFKEEGLSSWLWLAAGAISMGVGIWTMHFVGMLAFSMEMPFSYNIYITALSLLVAMAASAFAIYMASRSKVGNVQIGLSGIVLGIGIASMHYSGMAAMEMQATISYEPVLLFSSILIAIVAATAAIWIAFTLSRAAEKGLLKLKVIAAMVMGVAICGMHYTGMAAAIYVPMEGVMLDGSGIISDAQNMWMASVLVLAALVIIGVTHLTIFYDYRISAERNISEKAEQEAFQLSNILDDSFNEIYLFSLSTLRFIKVNKGAIRNLGYSEQELMRLTPLDIKTEMNIDKFNALTQSLKDGTKGEIVFDAMHKRADGSRYPVNVHLQLSRASSTPVFVAIVADITERKKLEDQVVQSRKLESIGQLAAGIAHEINTPSQFVGDNIRFLTDSFGDLAYLIKSYEELEAAVRENSVTPELLDSIAEAIKKADPEYLIEEIPSALKQSQDGIVRISKIVLAMKEFSHPGGAEKEPVNINKNISSTIVVASNEWKYVANISTDLDESLPLVLCHPQEISQVILNMLVNAAHAIEEKNGASSPEKGEINISTRSNGKYAEILIKDSGNGIPDGIKDRVFDPFFTTKGVGKGTGQGLSMAYATITEKHKGKLTVTSTAGAGTTFIIQIPLDSSEVSAEMEMV